MNHKTFLTYPKTSKPLPTRSFQFVKPKPKLHDVSTSIHHWYEYSSIRQLRDMLQYRDGLLYGVNHKDVFSYDPKTRVKETLMSGLSFTPTCTAVNCGYVAVGGPVSQLAVRRLDNNNWYSIRFSRMHQSTLCSTINNAIHIAPCKLDPSKAFLLVCNNDKCVRVFDLPEMRPIATIQVPAAVNHGKCSFLASISPDGSMLVVVGDSKDVILYSVVPTGGYKLLDVQRLNNDAGFSCSWDTLSRSLAVATQDGFVCIWDVRMMKDRIATLKASQTGQRGACRVARFTRAFGIDLLAFSEHVSCVNLYDTRNYQDNQILRVSPSDMDMSVSGIAFGEKDRSLFVGMEGQLQEYVVDHVERLCVQYASIS